MKGVLHILTGALLLTLLAGCASETETGMDYYPSGEKAGGYRYSISASGLDEDIAIGVYGGGLANAEAALSTSEGTREWVFRSPEILAGGGGTVLYFYAPRYAHAGGDAAGAVIEISPVQGQTAGAFDLSVLPRTASCQLQEDLPEGEVLELDFRPLASLVTFRVFSSDASAVGETIKSIIVEAQDGISGSFVYDFTASAVAEKCEGSTVTVQLSDAPAVGTSVSDAAIIKAVLAAGEHDGTITVRTTEGSYVVDLPSGMQYPLEGASVDIDLADSRKDTRAGIWTAEDFLAFAAAARSGASLSDWMVEGAVTLMADIELDDTPWTPIANFDGVLDGGGHSLGGILVQTSSDAGLFGTLSGSIRNLTLSGTCSFTATGKRCGAFAATLAAGARLENCVNRAPVKGATECLGGLFGFAQGTDEAPIVVKDCANFGAVTSASASSGHYRMGGIAGGVESGVQLSSVSNFGPVTDRAQGNHRHRIGGVVGNLADCALADARNEGAVTVDISTNNYMSVGGIAGDSWRSNYSRCINTAPVSLSVSVPGAGPRSVGGIVGQIEKDDTKTPSQDLIDCQNSGDVSLRIEGEGEYLANAGGIVGTWGYPSNHPVGGQILRCTNSGRISAATGGYIANSTNQYWSGVGGIAGFARVNSSRTVLVKDCVNSGEVAALASTVAIPEGKYLTHPAGGIVGNANWGVPIENCSNEGLVRTDGIRAAVAGGIAGAGEVYLKECVHSGTVLATSHLTWYGHLGGMVGRTYAKGSVDDCTFSGSVVYGGNRNADSDVGLGGIIGSKYQAVPVRGCKVSGTILFNGETSHGSVIGIVNNSSEELSGCTIGTAFGRYDAEAPDYGVSKAVRVLESNYQLSITGRESMKLSGNVFDSSLPAKAPRAVLLGDSITEYWGQTTKGHPFFFTDYAFVNRGIAGQVSAQICSRFDSEVAPLQPKSVVILAGTNDIAGNTGAAADNAGILDNLKAICTAARGAGIVPVLCSVLPCREYNWRKEIQPAERIRELNALIRSYADSESILYVDYYTPMADEDGGMNAAWQFSATDGCHVNRTGYSLMESVLLNALEANEL